MTLFSHWPFGQLACLSVTPGKFKQEQTISIIHLLHCAKITKSMIMHIKLKERLDLHLNEIWLFLTAYDNTFCVNVPSLLVQGTLVVHWIW
jgi:hypothetical protein